MWAPQMFPCIVVPLHSKTTISSSINRSPPTTVGHIAAKNFDQNKKLLSSHTISALTFTSIPKMSDKCGNCDCSDKSQCVKKGYAADIVETQISYTDTVVVDAPAADEHDGKCKCGSSCTCTNCTCGH